MDAHPLSGMQDEADPVVRPGNGAGGPGVLWRASDFGTRRVKRRERQRTRTTML